MNHNTSSQNTPLEELDFFNIEGFRHDGFLGCSNAPVYRYVDIHNSNRLLAFKELKIKDEEDYQRVVSNFRTLQRIKRNKHPNIIQILGFCKSIKQKVYGEDVSAYLIMEHCEGNLDDYIQMRKKLGDKFDLTEIKKFFAHTISALEFLQSNLSIAHRDIKPENILVDNKDFKIADLDDSKIDLNKTMEKSLVLGTLSFMAPELLKAYNRMKDRLSYNAYKSDVYSLGLCLLYMCTFYKFSKNERIDGVTNKPTYQKQIKLLRSQVKDKYGITLSKLLKMMLEIDPALRPDFSTLKKMAIEKAFLEESDFYTIGGILQQKRQQISLDLNRPKLEATLGRMKQHCILSDSEGTTAHYSSDNQETSEGSMRANYMNCQQPQYHHHYMPPYQGDPIHYNNLQSNLPKVAMQKQHSNPNQRQQQSSPQKSKPLSSSHSSRIQDQQQQSSFRNTLQGIDPNSRLSGSNPRPSPTTSYNTNTQTFSFDQKRNSYLQGCYTYQDFVNNGLAKQNSQFSLSNSGSSGFPANYNNQSTGVFTQGPVSFNAQGQTSFNSSGRRISTNLNQGQKIGGGYMGTTMPEPILEFNSMKQDDRSNTDRTESNQSQYYYQEKNGSKSQKDVIPTQSNLDSRTNSQMSCNNNQTNSHANNSLYPESQLSNSIIAERQNTFTVSEIIRENQNNKIQQQLNNQQQLENEDLYIDDGMHHAQCIQDLHQQDYINGNDYYVLQDDAEGSYGKLNQQRQQYLLHSDKISNSSSSQNKPEKVPSQKSQHKDIHLYDDANQNTCTSSKNKKKTEASNMVKIVEDDSNFFDTFIDSQSQTPNQNMENSKRSSRRRGFNEFQNPDQIRQLSKQRKYLTFVIVVMILFTIALGLFYIIEQTQTSGSGSGSSTDPTDNPPDVDPKTYTVEECKLLSKMYLAGKCYTKCPQQNFYPDTAQMICVQCDPSCLECTWGEANSCKKCKTDLYLLSLNQQTGMCVSDCPNYFRKDSTVGKCIKCPENCISCEVDTNSADTDLSPYLTQNVICSNCASEYYLLGGILCVNVCPKDTIKDDINRTCQVTELMS